jgi:hypothetical protein
MHAEMRENLWKQVEDSVKRGLPASAITTLEKIVSGATRDKAWAEAAKAISRKIVLEDKLQGNESKEKITRMEAQVAVARPEIMPVLRTIQAHWLWDYFQHFRWRIMRRTSTREPSGQDIDTWDLHRIFSEIDNALSHALSAALALKKIPVSQFGDVLVSGDFPDVYRPTLFDFIAHEALRFYTSGEQAGAWAEDAFEVSADTPVFGPLEAFMAWKPPRTNTKSPAYKAILLYQDLLRFHQADRDATALIDTDLARIVWAGNVAVGGEKNARYKSALGHLVKRWPDHEVSALALYRWGRASAEGGDLVEARELALRGQRAHPQAAGGLLCRKLAGEIDRKSAEISTERVWNVPRPEITVRYRNITELFFRMVAINWSEFLVRNHRCPEDLSKEERATVLRRKPVLEWSAKLPATADLKERSETLPVPTTLKPGFYFLIASQDRGFSEEDNEISFTNLWVSDLALVVLVRHGTVGALVLNAITGEPIPRAVVVPWHKNTDSNRVMRGAPQKTDADGWASFIPPRNRSLLLHARANGQEICSEKNHRSLRLRKALPSRELVLLTDRAIYRPGQMLYYKGIAIHLDREQDQYKCLAGRVVEVALTDPNGSEIAKTQHRANDYGSFSGSFVAPRNRMTGEYRLIASLGEGYGATYISVEEYKRPKFRVSLEAPRAAPRLNDTISLNGKAEAYTGAAIDGAQVKWRVVREVRWPGEWRWSGEDWRGGKPDSLSNEIAHGVTQTRPDGGFAIEFRAIPDPRVNEISGAHFSFLICADVTDSAGETQSNDFVVSVGFIALRAKLSADDWQTIEQPVVLQLTTTTFDGEPQPANGTLRLVRLKEPGRIQRSQLPGRSLPWDTLKQEDFKECSKSVDWCHGKTVVQQKWTTDATGTKEFKADLAAGVYRALLKTEDRFGKEVTALLDITVLDPAADRFAIKVPSRVSAPKWEAEPGREWLALWGTGYDEGRAFVEIEHRGKFLQRYWTRPGVTQAQIKQTVTESLRGGFTVHVTQIRENRAYFHSHKVEVPWSNKELDVAWERFVSRLEPGRAETWTAVVKPKVPDGAQAAKRLAAEFVASLYDECLVQLRWHDWVKRFGGFRQDRSHRTVEFCNRSEYFQMITGRRLDLENVERSYRKFAQDLVAGWWENGMPAYQGWQWLNHEVFSSEPVVAAIPTTTILCMKLAQEAGIDSSDEQRAQSTSETPSRSSLNLAQVIPRKNLNETAFFFPHLTTDENGIVRITFKMPEALTQWRFLGFAHDKHLRSGFLEDHAVTAKELMVQPNPPRFLREGDMLEFTVKVSNQSAARQTGTVRLNLVRADSDEALDALLGNCRPELEFIIPARESKSFSWRLTVPDGAPFLIYRAVGSTGRLSDGEEGYLPVLPRRILVTESLPLQIRVKTGQGAVEKKFTFAKLIDSNKSNTLTHENLVVRMVSNPAWAAVLALPYLMEFPHQCAEQVFNRFYANTLARSIAESDPKIRQLLDLWKNTPAVDSPLEKNQDLKAVMIEETPWLHQAQNDNQARRNLGLLFDPCRAANESARALRQLGQMRSGDGAWPWFPGGHSNDYITLYITAGFGRLRHLGATSDASMAVQSLDRLDAWINTRYRQSRKSRMPVEYVLSPLEAFYLYGRSFFLKDRPMANEHLDAVEFHLEQGRRHWLQMADRQSQGHLALALKRWGGTENRAAASDIMRSIQARSVSSEEMGMFWRDLDRSWWWYRAPIETQALMIEAFDEVLEDHRAAEECQLWLLKQKQIQDWRTTKATADAAYALLLRGRNLLANDKPVQVSVGGIDALARAQKRLECRNQRQNCSALEPGTGFYEIRFLGAEITPRLGQISVRMTDEGVAWGSVHWQYLEDMGKVTPHEETPLRLKKRLFKKVNTARGPQLQAVTGPIAVGDELVVRLELKADRDMEYVHVKDQRGSGTEPMNVLSRYTYQNGLAYYESTRDTASHFFIEYLPKGVYVLEYSTRIQHRGQYPTGIATIQCMYAPEFNSHSGSYTLNVEEGR